MEEDDGDDGDAGFDSTECPHPSEQTVATLLYSPHDLSCPVSDVGHLEFGKVVESRIVQDSDLRRKVCRNRIDGHMWFYHISI